MLSAADLHARGVEAMHSGRIRAARAPLLKALSRTEDDALLGAIEASLAWVEAETGDRAEAGRLCDRALDRPGIDAETRGAILSQRALLSFVAGRYAESLHDFDAAIHELVNSALFRGRAHINRGNLYLHRHDPDRALSDFESGLSILEEVAPAPEVAMARHNVGYARLLGGDLPGALRDMDAARVVLAPLSAVAAATCDLDRAEVLTAAGLAGEARVSMDLAARALGAARLRRRQAEAELALARALVNERPAEALAVAGRAARRFERNGVAAGRLQAEAVRAVAAGELTGPRLGTVDATMRHRMVSEEALDALIDELRREGLHSTARQVMVASSRSHLRRGNLSEARARLTALGSLAHDPLSVRLVAADVRAELHAAARRGSQARAVLRTGLADLHTWQSSFGSLDLQTNVVGHGARLGVRGLALAVESRSDAVLFEWSERARMLASRVQPVRAPQDEETSAELVELRSEPSPAREAELRQRIRERAWRHRGSGEVADPVGLAELRSALGEDTALAAYVVTADRVVGLVATDRGTRRHELGPRAALDRLLGGLLADLDMAAGDLPAVFAAPVLDALTARLAALDAMLVAPLVGDLDARRVVLTPSGVLAGVPWTLLPGLARRPVTVAQSATSWLARRATPLRTATAGFVAGPRVPRAEAEVRAAAQEWGDAPVLAGADARAEAVTALAGRVDVLHVAAHGRHSSENPLFSGLELADGTWFGYDIDQVAAVPDVVLLSACEVGRSSVRWGEELIGMTAAWLHAGARCVLASPAAVNDEAAYDALVRVHAGLASGLDPAAALAGALAAAAPDLAPAPFVCFG